MSLQTHLAELAARHRALEAELKDACAHPATSDEQIATLKRTKLRIKDEMLRLESELHAVH